jgi:aminopeptidase N
MSTGPEQGTTSVKTRRYRRPIVCNTYKEPIDLFDRHLYQKGGLGASHAALSGGSQSLLRLDQDLLRRQSFTAGGNDRHDQGHRKDDRSQSCVRSSTSGSSALAIPSTRSTYAYDDKQKLATVKVSQVQKLEELTGLFSLPIDMSFDFADGTPQSRHYHMSAKRSTRSASLSTRSRRCSASTRVTGCSRSST